MKSSNKVDYLALNKKAWDKRTKIHIESKFYDLDRFINGKSSLNEIEIEEVGEVKGKSLLHLQCHFGLDTLSWARLGAEVTGVDLSNEAISKAVSLAETLKIDCRFVCSDIYEFGESNNNQYDIVFTSYGVLCWLPDLTQWAQTIYNSLKVGGQVNVVEFHPFNDILSGYSYFNNSTPDVESEGTYTENCPGEKSTVVTWPHPISDVINALIVAGIRIESFKEYPYCPYDCFDGLEKISENQYQLISSEQKVPLVYSIKGRKIND